MNVPIYKAFRFFMNNTDMFVSFGFDTTSTFIGISVFFQIFSPVSYIFSIISNKLTRIMEFQADAFTIEHNLDKFLQEGLKKLIVKNLGDMDPAAAFFMGIGDRNTFVIQDKTKDGLKIDTISMPLLDAEGHGMSNATL